MRENCVFWTKGRWRRLANDLAGHHSTLTLPAGVTSGTVTTDATAAILVTTTNDRGEVITTAPATITSAVVQSDANGVVYTVTQIVRNPSGSLNDGSGSSGGGTSSFFNNTGAVVGVFVVVGIAGAAILLGFGFLFMRRRRRQRLDR